MVWVINRMVGCGGERMCNNVGVVESGVLVVC